MHALASLVPATLLAIASAAPTAQPVLLASRQAPCEPSAWVRVVFMGATRADYSIWCFPRDTRDVAISYVSSVSHVATNGGPCTFVGLDGLSLTIPGTGTWDVGPPQRIVSVSCGCAVGEADAGSSKR